MRLLGCPCDQPDPVPAFQYHRPPEGETRFAWKAQSYRRGYHRCRQCGHWFAEIHMDLADFYQCGYVDGTYGDRMAEVFRKILRLPAGKSDNAGRVGRVLEFAKKKWGNSRKPSLLDVGSGLAVFPMRMREAGWKVTALDPDARAAVHAREEAKVNAVHADFLDWEPEPGRGFDVISFNKVLEHVENPLAMLARARCCILPGGFLYVEVPNVLAAESGPDREEFFIEHLHVFSETSLHSAMVKSGWRLVHLAAIHEPSGKYTLAGFAEAP